MPSRLWPLMNTAKSTCHVKGSEAAGEESLSRRGASQEPAVVMFANQACTFLPWTPGHSHSVCTAQTAKICTKLPVLVAPPGFCTSVTNIYPGAPAFHAQALNAIYLCQRSSWDYHLGDRRRSSHLLARWQTGGCRRRELAEAQADGRASQPVPGRRVLRTLVWRTS
jgi:hypothetical protein